MNDTHKKSPNKGQWLPLFDSRTKDFLANQNYNQAKKIFTIFAFSSVLAFSMTTANASEFQRPYGLPTANITKSYGLPTANTNSLDPSNVSRTGASAAFPIKQREAYFDTRTLTLRQSAPIIRQNDPARANVVIGRDRAPNYFTGDSGIPTDFSR